MPVMIRTSAVSGLIGSNSVVMTVVYPVLVRQHLPTTCHRLSVQVLVRCRKLVEVGSYRLAGFFSATRNISADLAVVRSEEHTSELQSRGHLVCRLLLEK